MLRESTKRTCLTFRSSQIEALKILSRESGAPAAELVRRAVDAFLGARLAGPDHETGQAGRGTRGITTSPSPTPTTAQ
jgi:hypothetical protein